MSDTLTLARLHEQLTALYQKFPLLGYRPLTGDLYRRAKGKGWVIYRCDSVSSEEYSFSCQEPESESESEGESKINISLGAFLLGREFEYIPPDGPIVQDETEIVKDFDWASVCVTGALSGILRCLDGVDSRSIRHRIDVPENNEEQRAKFCFSLTTDSLKPLETLAYFCDPRHSFGETAVWNAWKVFPRWNVNSQWGKGQVTEYWLESNSTGTKALEECLQLAESLADRLVLRNSIQKFRDTHPLFSYIPEPGETFKHELGGLYKCADVDATALVYTFKRVPGKVSVPVEGGVDYRYEGLSEEEAQQVFYVCHETFYEQYTRA